MSNHRVRQSIRRAMMQPSAPQPTGSTAKTRYDYYRDLLIERNIGGNDVNELAQKLALHDFVRGAAKIRARAEMQEALVEGGISIQGFGLKPVTELEQQSADLVCDIVQKNLQGSDERFCDWLVEMRQLRQSLGLPTE